MYARILANSYFKVLHYEAISVLYLIIFNAIYI